MLLPLMSFALEASFDIICTARPLTTLQHGLAHAHHTTTADRDAQVAIILTANIKLGTATTSRKGHDAAIRLALGQLALHVVAIFSVHATACRVSTSNTTFFVGLHLANDIAGDFRLQELLAGLPLGLALRLETRKPGIDLALVATSLVAFFVNASNHVATTAFHTILSIGNATTIQS